MLHKRVEDDLEEGFVCSSRGSISQYVESVTDFSSQYGVDFSISYNAQNIIGEPSKFPDYGDFAQTFVLRTYGRWWNDSPSGTKVLMSQNVEKYPGQDYIDVRFEVAVYPAKICIFETYNPGAVLRIWAWLETKCWFLLWEGEPRKAKPVSRAFQPPICCTSAKTNLLRIEMSHLHLDYYSAFDGVLLVGSSELISGTPRPDNKTELQDLNLLESIIHLGLNEVPYNDIPTTFQEFLEKYGPNLCESWRKVHPFIDNSDFSRLPREVILEIFAFLDIPSLSRCARVNRLFYSLATDHFLYKELNLKPQWYCVTSKVLSMFSARCSGLQKLDLSWCGNYRMMDPVTFIVFIDMCGRQIRNLRLNCCRFVNNECLKKIADTCTELQELGLRGCQTPTTSGFYQLSRLTQLRHLDLYRSSIDLISLTSILRNSSHLQHLNIGSCGNVAGIDDIAVTLANFNPDLVSLDIWKTRGLTTVGVAALARCSKLQELDLGWSVVAGMLGGNIQVLVKGCPLLRKLFLGALRDLSDQDIVKIAESCHQLQQLDLLGARRVTVEAVWRVLNECQQLQLLDLSFCEQIPDAKVEQWSKMFPCVSIKRSFQGERQQWHE